MKEGALDTRAESRHCRMDLGPPRLCLPLCAPTLLKLIVIPGGAGPISHSPVHAGLVTTLTATLCLLPAGLPVPFFKLEAPEGRDNVTVAVVPALGTFVVIP
jgi:hypothetical protein